MHGNQKINKETEHLNNTVEQLYLTNMYRTLHPTSAENTSFTSTCETFSMTDHMLDSKTNLNKFMKIQIIKSIFLNHSEMIPEIKIRMKTGKCSKSGN